MFGSKKSPTRMMDEAIVRQVEEQCELSRLATNCATCDDSGYVARVTHTLNHYTNRVSESVEFSRCECGCAVPQKVQKYVDERRKV